VPSMQMIVKRCIYLGLKVIVTMPAMRVLMPRKLPGPYNSSIIYLNPTDPLGETLECNYNA
jgi:hypothetical protein